MKVLLIQPPHYFEGFSREPDNVPLGLAYLARSLLDHGHQVQVLDIWAHQYVREQILDDLKRREYDVIGIGALSTQYNYVKWLTTELKALSDAPIILGGALPTHSSDTVLNHTPVDFCVIGEGEQTLPELLDHLNTPEFVQGIAFRKDGQVHHTPERPYVQDLDTIPFPEWDVFPTDLYLRVNHMGLHAGYRTINLVAHRGCPYSCRYCSLTFRSVRWRSIGNIVQEIQILQQKYGIQAIDFNDELLAISKKRMYELCEGLKPLKIWWNCQGRVNIVDHDLMKAMKDAGCVAIGFGIESGSQRILDAMDRRQTIEQSKTALLNARKLGIEPIIQIIFGYPGESDKTIQENIEFFREVRMRPSGFFTLTPLPGTEIYRRAFAEGRITDEDAYLQELDWGYNSGRPLLVNFTDLADNEFFQKKRDMEASIDANYYKTHRQEQLNYYLQRIATYYRKHGLLQTMRRATRGDRPLPGVKTQFVK